MAELKPCPFCGFDMPLIYSYVPWEECPDCYVPWEECPDCYVPWEECPDCYVSCKIVCGNCSAEIRRKTEELAIEAWNRRANDGHSRKAGGIATQREKGTYPLFKNWKSYNQHF